MSEQRDLFQVQVEQEARKMAEAMLLDPASLRAILDDQNRLLIAAQAKVEEMRPAAEFGQAIIDDGRYYKMEEVAKILEEKLLERAGRSVGRNTLFSILRELGILQPGEGIKDPSHNLPYQRYIKQGWFVVKLTKTPRKMVSTTKVTGKGMAEIFRTLVNHFGGAA